MRRSFFVCVLSVLVAVPVAVGAYLFAFGEDESEAVVVQSSSPSTKVVANYVSPSQKDEILNPGTIHHARKTKSNLNSALVESCDTIAQKNGTTSEEVMETIEELEIDDWNSTALPETATVSSTFQMTLDNENTLVTTYNDPDDRYVTFCNSECTVTLKGPEDAGENLYMLAAA